MYSNDLLRVQNSYNSRLIFLKENNLDGLWIVKIWHLPYTQKIVLLTAHYFDQSDSSEINCHNQENTLNKNDQNGNPNGVTKLYLWSCFFPLYLAVKIKLWEILVFLYTMFIFSQSKTN